jgi:pyrroloquinoline-quinone synthase
MPDAHLPGVLSPDALEERLRALGQERYHHLHTFHKLLHGGRLSLGQVQAWALNRYVYQAAIPRKDAAILSRLEDREVRREWVHRILDHDGTGSDAGGTDGQVSDAGGIERWLRLTDGLKLARAYVVSQKGALPATRFAVEAYVRFAQERSSLEAIASSLTELFAPAIHAERIAGMLEHYDFIDNDLIAYFRRRLDQAPRDASFALRYVREHARTAEQQRDVLGALSFKMDVLWAQLDALYFAYVEPGFVPPGAFRPSPTQP